MAGALSRRAAQYLRVSSDQQRYSLAGQSAQVAAYAERHGFQVVRTYQDAGVSGVTTAGRKGLRALLADVVGGHPRSEIARRFSSSRKAQLPLAVGLAGDAVIVSIKMAAISGLAAIKGRSARRPRLRAVGEGAAAAQRLRRLRRSRALRRAVTMIAAPLSVMMASLAVEPTRMGLRHGGPQAETDGERPCAIDGPTHDALPRAPPSKADFTPFQYHAPISKARRNSPSRP
ncbi:recombinase family protein [Phenylobacterium sp. NIBR 498073]|nr:recombinase family protein [Phenylobacterium sp. NIBR 498073]WGU39018.1 recombinase family protein [Phenylobacterium sp. NIBR 498073]